jgi:hypothetical protein
VKKIIIGGILAATSLLAEVVTILPYSATISYDKDTAKSVKDRAVLFGTYASFGNLNYLVELDYSHINTTYKDRTQDNLNQDDITLLYGKYYKKSSYKVGIHHISTNDVELGDGNILIASAGGYSWVGYDKYSYGLDGYYSIYKNGRDENNVAKTVNIVQFTPYFSFYKAFSINTKNTIAFKVNYQIAGDYVTKDYLSYEVSDTFYYKSFFTTLKAFDGEMRTGVKDGGMTVYNTLDLLKNGYGVKLGYYISKNAIFSASYDVNYYEESGLTREGVNSVVSASFSYNF